MSARKYRFSLQEKVNIVLDMLNDAVNQKGQEDLREVKYWIERLHGYQKIAQLKGIAIDAPSLDKRASVPEVQTILFNFNNPPEATAQ